MKQVVQKLGNGDIYLLELPTPILQSGQLLIKTTFSLLSSGTERMLLEFGKSNILEKVKNQPEKAQEVFEKINNDGLLPTFKAVNNKLDSLIPIGYSNVGRVIAVAKDVTGFQVGDRVVSNGPHAEIVTVPQNLCAKIPNDVSDSQAAFTVVSAVGLQAIRLSNPTFSETHLVIGLGLIGLLTAQILKANGCQVLAYDLDDKKCEIANKLGIDSYCLKDPYDILPICEKYSSGNGIDGVIVTASAQSTSPIEIAAKVSRKKGRIILVGVTGLDIKREWFYKKELSFQVSCSYGPDRYDSTYQKSSREYPKGLVRWTTKRNFEAVLYSISKGYIKTDLLKSHEFLFEDTPKAFDKLCHDKAAVGILLKYKNDVNSEQKVLKLNPEVGKSKGDFDEANPVIGFIGAGNYVKSSLLPAFTKTESKLSTLVSISGINASELAKKYSFDYLTSDTNFLLKKSNCNTIVIASRHDSHANFVIESIKEKKNIFVEKPLCLNLNELNEIEENYFKHLSSYEEVNNPIFMVGFNRRFAPLTQKLKSILKNNLSMKSVIYTCNAGFVDEDHWVHSSKVGGGRIIGEAIHFVDLLRFLIDSPIEDLKVNFAKDNKLLNDSFIVSIRFQDGSIGSINYFANGNKKFNKERLEVFSNGQIYQIDNFKDLNVWGKNKSVQEKLFFIDKGQKNCTKSFVDSIRNKSVSPIPIDEIFEVHRKLFEALT